MADDSDQASRRDDRGLETFQLIELARSGDARARDVVIRRYLPRLETWISGRLPSSALGMIDTLDLVQDVITKAWSHLEEFENRGEGAFLAYLRTAARNRLRDEYRRQRPRQDEISDSIEDRAPSPLDEVLGAAAEERYEQALQRLNDDYREAIIAYVEFGLGIREIGELLQKPSYDAARMTLQRALVRLAEEMAQ